MYESTKAPKDSDLYMGGLPKKYRMLNYILIPDIQQIIFCLTTTWSIHKTKAVLCLK